ncbi:type VII secretion-associated serine protease mycosin [Micromonospora sp. NPDC049559]|uniref:type VII secretion-associated serine protease mycosin n=1 Tax=Micromonospora sp. NPDC049559 TaxID=3155923 RepID=UPI003430B0C0
MLLSAVGIATALAGPSPAAQAQPSSLPPAAAQPLPAPSVAPVVPERAPAEPAVARRAVPPRTDPVRDDQWQLGELNAASAWRVSTGKGVTVAVIDSGVDGSHPDLAGQVLPGLDLVQPSDANGQSDPVGHGTTVAALIAGRDDDSQGVVGLAPDAKILPVRVLDAENRYDDAMIVAKGVRWAVDNGARVINLSLGGTGDSPALAAALDYAFARDVVVVACTGNLSPSSPNTRVWYPAREPGVIAVAGLERDTDSLWSGSITGPETVLSAPATNLHGARPGGFWRVQGTSFAAPLVAATAALVRSHWPTMSAGDVVNRLIRTARDLGPAGRDDRFGFGLVNPVAALNGEVARVDHNPLDDLHSPAVVGFGPAPGADTAVESTEGEPSGLGIPGAHRRSNWAAQPAGGPNIQPPEGAWVGGTLFVLLLLGSAVLLRRFR